MLQKLCSKLSLMCNLSITLYWITSNSINVFSHSLERGEGADGGREGKENNVQGSQLRENTVFWFSSPYSVFLLAPLQKRSDLRILLRDGTGRGCCKLWALHPDSKAGEGAWQ